MVQPAAVPQAPALLQVWVEVVLAHCLLPGAHTPLHLLLAQAWPVQAVGEPHPPCALHRRICVKPTHSLEAGVHTPVH